VQPSKRITAHVVFYCPNCGTDRLGSIGSVEERINRENGERAQRGGPQVQCTACGVRKDSHSFDPTPVTDRRTRELEGLRALVTATARAGDPWHPGTQEVAQRVMVEAGLVEYDEASYAADVQRSDVAHWLRNTMLVLAETLDGVEVSHFLAGGVLVAWGAGEPTQAQVDQLAAVASTLGLTPLRARLLVNSRPASLVDERRVLTA
jgi:hypothetical protein